MQLMIMRHGEAEPTFRDDANRKLTTQGFIEAQQGGVWLKQKVDSIDYAIVSPFVRAKQTHEMVASIVTCGYTETSAEITPSGIPSSVHDYIDGLIASNPNISSLILVSHMPLVTYLLDSFTRKMESRMFCTGGIACLDYQGAGQSAVVTGFFTPNQ